MTRIIVFLCGLVALFIVYPIGVLVPFLWNFTWNPKGWVFEKFHFNDSTDILIYFFGISEEKIKYDYLYEDYDTYLHFILALLLRDKMFGNRAKEIAKVRASRIHWV